jgi:uncharacterized protein DUF2760
MNATRLVVALVSSLAVAAGNWAVAHAIGAPSPVALAWLVGAPIALALVLALIPGPAAAAPMVDRIEVAAPPPPPRPAPADGALRLLGLLQEQGRLVDFLEEDLAPYPDDQIGGAVRAIHEGCRKALHAQFALEPVLRGAEGEDVTVDAGFDAAEVRLTGNVAGVPPFRGVLRHGGWRATSASLPDRQGIDPRVIAPAEVEIP